MKKRDQHFLERMDAVALECECAKRSIVPKARRERLAEARRLLRKAASHPDALDDDDEDEEEERSVSAATGRPRAQEGCRPDNISQRPHARDASDSLRCKIGGSGRII
jgi:hypothetical protein